MAINVHQGSSGETVKNLQTILNFLILAPPPLAVDGLFGPKTAARVRQFQQQSKLSADGIVGPLTGRALIAGVLQKIFS
jgi:peptidoglycan hydrolase-like protein with peptidoglycan-binding domain